MHCGTASSIHHLCFSHFAGAPLINHLPSLGSQFPHLENEGNIRSCLRESLWGLSGILCVKYLAECLMYSPHLLTVSHLVIKVITVLLAPSSPSQSLPSSALHALTLFKMEIKFTHYESHPFFFLFLLRQSPILSPRL